MLLEELSLPMGRESDTGDAEEGETRSEQTRNEKRRRWYCNAVVAQATEKPVLGCSGARSAPH